MKRLILFILLVLLPIQSYASEKYISAGFNLSTFYNSDSKILPGFSIELGKEWRKSERAYFSLGIEYLYRGTRVENKYVYSEQWLLKINADWQVGYLAFPFKYSYMFAEQKRVYFTAALTPCWSIVDNSKISTIFIIEPGDFPEEDADYFMQYDAMLSEFRNSTIDVRVGLGKKFDWFSVDLQTRIDLYGSVDELRRKTNINSKFISFCLIINYYF